MRQIQRQIFTQTYMLRNKKLPRVGTAFFTVFLQFFRDQVSS